jgi:hypothetical protein
MRARVTGRFGAFADFELEAYLCGELEATRRAELDQALLNDVALHAYIAERNRARAEFVVAHPLRMTAADRAELSLRRVPAARSLLPRWLIAAALAPACLLALWWTGSLLAPDRSASRLLASASERDTIRTKGPGLAAELYVKRGEHVFRPRADEALKPGDFVRLSVEASRAGYLSVLARDERGAVSVYYDRLPIGAGRFTVPDSLQLDTSSSDELWLVVVTGDPRPAQGYARGFASGEVPNTTHLLLTLHKEKP